MQLSLFENNEYLEEDRDSWSTPQALFDELDAEFQFTLDAAASAANAKCKRFFSIENSALDQDWCEQLGCWERETECKCDCHLKTSNYELTARDAVKSNQQQKSSSSQKPQCAEASIPIARTATESYVETDNRTDEKIQSCGSDCLKKSADTQPAKKVEKRSANHLSSITTSAVSGKTLSPGSGTKRFGVHVNVIGNSAAHIAEIDPSSRKITSFQSQHTIRPEQSLGMSYPPASAAMHQKEPKHWRSGAQISSESRRSNDIVENCGKCSRINSIVWLNCPYSNPLIKHFMRKAYEESLQGCTVVCLVIPSTCSEWWHKYALKGELRFLNKRVNFIPPPGVITTSGNNRDSVIVIFRPPVY